MKALTLHQPWASLVALGVKTIETRSWSTSYRGPLAIHAGRHRPPMMYLPPLSRSRDDPMRGQRWSVIDTITAPEHQRPHITDPGHPMRDHVPKWAKTPTLFYPSSGPHGRPWDRDAGTSATEQGAAIYLPLGAVVATCRLIDVVPTDDLAAVNFSEGSGWERDPRHYSIGDAEVPFGDFSPGRFAWLLDDVQPTTARCPACWGDGRDPCRPWGSERACATCCGSRTCEPVPARGYQKLWEWTP